MKQKHQHTSEKNEVKETLAEEKSTMTELQTADAPAESAGISEPAPDAAAADPSAVAVSADGTPAEGGAAEGEHHHHHHHHHSKAWHRRRRFQRKLRKNGKTVLIVVASLLAVVALAIASAVVAYLSMIGAVDDNNDPVVPDDGVNKIVIQEFKGDVSMTHETVEMYMNSPSRTTVANVLSSYGRRGLRTDFSVPVTFSFAVANIENRVVLERITCFVSENEDFSDADVYPIDVSEQLKVKLDLLKCNTTYYIKLIVLQSNGVELVETAKFHTAPLPRIMTVERLFNVRDIGGWAAGDQDKIIRQGLLIRGSELDGFNRSDYKASPTGVASLLATLRIRTELDLRSKGSYIDGMNMLGKGVNHYHCSVPAYDDFFEDGNQSKIRDVFAVLADEDNYPIYIHDTESIDRTGTVIAVLEAFLGVSEENIVREYDLSAFSSLQVNRSNLSSALTELKKCQGRTLSEKARNFLLDCGVTEYELDSIRSIYLGD